MEDFPNNESTNQGEQNVTNETELLSEMPSFEEHMEEHIKEHTEETERDPSIAEKYYEQAKEYKERWLEEAEEEIKKAEELKPEEVVAITYIESDEQIGYRDFNIEDEKDMASFEEYKSDKKKRAEKFLKAVNEDASIKKMAKCIKNTEYLDGIATKLKNNEEFSEEEKEYIGKIPDSIYDGPSKEDYFNYMRIDTYGNWLKGRGFATGLDYLQLAKEEGYNSADTIIAKARIRELEKQGRLLLDKDEDIQKYLGAMEQNRNTNPFSGETNMDSETGEARTFTPEDNYRRLEGESEEDYAKRLRSITLKTRLAEKRQEQE